MTATATTATTPASAAAAVAGSPTVGPRYQLHQPTIAGAARGRTGIGDGVVVLGVDSTIVLAYSDKENGMVKSGRPVSFGSTAAGI
jgi:hypothetical protein